ncbi:hypothetical protein L6164_023070 [Bauhinia variegata]|uniref:Uncharacterized protein n=1 Tax=Bauhinia variegata TaxID=167791 RepID=A0ACB9MHK0_BAUVA|nr:hypothetical protein L6164_023070 [Bauhinia variegata]
MENNSSSGNSFGNHTVEVASGDDDSYFSSFPAGIRFMPTDAELIIYYLGKRILNEPLPPNQIVEVVLYKFHPQELSQFRTQGEGEWFFFTPRDRKYPNGKRPARAASTGYWKATGAEKIVFADDGVRVGYKQALVFYEGKPPNGVKTNWMMHEYRLHNPPRRQRAGPHDMRLDDWVLCKIYEKGNSKRRHVEENNAEDNSSKKRQQIESSDTVEDAANAETPQNDNGFRDANGDFDHTLENYQNDNGFRDANGDFDRILENYQNDNGFRDANGDFDHTPENYQNANGFRDANGDFDRTLENYRNDNGFRDVNGDFDHTLENYQNDNGFRDANGDFDRTLNNYQNDNDFLDAGGNSNQVPEDYQNDNGVLDSNDGDDFPNAILEDYQRETDSRDYFDEYFNMDNYLDHFSDIDKKSPPSSDKDKKSPPSSDKDNKPPPSSS